MSGNRISMLLKAMTEEQRRGAMVLLDHVSRPMTQEEITDCLVVKGVRRHKAILIAHAVKRFHLVALIGGEDRG